MTSRSENRCSVIFKLKGEKVYRVGIIQISKLTRKIEIATINPTTKEKFYIVRPEISDLVMIDTIMEDLKELLKTENTTYEKSIPSYEDISNLLKNRKLYIFDLPKKQEFLRLSYLKLICANEGFQDCNNPKVKFYAEKFATSEKGYQFDTKTYGECAVVRKVDPKEIWR